MVYDQTTRAWTTRAVSGDGLAVQKLIMVHHQRLRAIACQRIGPRMRAKIEPEDILQQVYADVIQHIREFKDYGKGAFFQWLTRIMDSKLVDAHRFYHAAARDIGREVKPADKSSARESLAIRAALDSVTPSRIFARLEVKSLLRAALAGLSSDHRRVLELRFLKGLPSASVAELMGRSQAAVQMLCARALRQLRKALSQLSRVEI